jgi:hypothetical protein
MLAKSHTEDGRCLGFQCRVGGAGLQGHVFLNVRGRSVVYLSVWCCIIHRYGNVLSGGQVTKMHK